MSGSASSICRRMNGRQICRLLRRRRAVAGRTPGHDVGDVDATCGRARSPPACGRAICRNGRRTAGPRCPRRGRALRRRTSPALSGCRRRTRAGVAVAFSAQPSNFSRMARSSSSVLALFAAARAAIAASSGAGGATSAAGAAFDLESPGSGRAAARGSARGGGLGRREAVDRLFADERIDARLGVEVENFARGGVVVGFIIRRANARREIFGCASTASAAAFGSYASSMAKIYPLRPLCIERMSRAGINHQRRPVRRVLAIFVHKGRAVRRPLPNRRHHR